MDLCLIFKKLMRHGGTEASVTNGLKYYPDGRCELDLPRDFHPAQIRAAAVVGISFGSLFAMGSDRPDPIAKIASAKLAEVSYPIEGLSRAADFAAHLVTQFAHHGRAGFQAVGNNLKYRNQ